MKILLITEDYPILNDKSAPKTFYNIVKSWELQGHSVDIIKPNLFFLSGIKYKTGWYENVYNVNYFTPFYFNPKEKLKDINFESYDKIIAYTELGKLLALNLEVDFTAGIINSDFDTIENPILNLLSKNKLDMVYKKVSSVICSSQVLKNKFIKKYPMYISKTSAVLSETAAKAVEIKQKPRYMDGIKSDYKRVLIYSNLFKRKELDKIINICKNTEYIQLTIIGAIEKHKQMKMSFDIVFLENLSKDRILERMRASDIFILPVEDEEICLDAMSSGCIIAGVNSCGLIKDGVNGFLYEPGRFEEKLNEILSNNNLKDIANEAVKTAEMFNNTAVEI